MGIYLKVNGLMAKGIYFYVMLRNGKGLYIYNNGDRYDGEFKND